MVEKEAMTGNSVENCANWFGFQISANSFAKFFLRSEVVEVRKFVFAQI